MVDASGLVQVILFKGECARVVGGVLGDVLVILMLGGIDC